MVKANERNLQLLKRHYLKTKKSTCNCIRIPDDITICMNCKSSNEEYKDDAVKKENTKQEISVKDRTEKNTEHRSKSVVGSYHKICSVCGEVKHISEFHKTKRKYGGTVYIYRHAKCNECRRLQKRNWYAKKKENKKS